MKNLRFAATLALIGALAYAAWIYFDGETKSTAAPSPAPALSLPNPHVQENESTLIYVPAGIKAGTKYPLIFALSPAADALGMLSTWSRIAEKHKWLVAASKTFRNGQRFDKSLQAIEIELLSVERRYPVDKDKVVFAGFSGGAMGSHAAIKFYPQQIRAVVVNTGMIFADFMTDDYPRDKIAVMLASPADFRYGEMKRDRVFLEKHGWTVKWIEFAAGHGVAPADSYDEAADWLASKL